MERKKMTKALIGESLKALMLDHPFEKITIKMITSEAGVIRPTFYNYFCDKYEVLEWIFGESIIEKMKDLFAQEMHAEAIKMLFVCMKRESAFYRKAFEVTGQNAFEAIVRKDLYALFLSELKPSDIESRTDNPLLTADMVASYYAWSLSDLLKLWVQEPFQNCSVEYMVDAYDYLMNHTIKDFMEPTDERR